MDMALSSATTRPLAQQLLRTRGQGITVFVQERVHSTTVGFDATAAFVQQLLAELEDSVAMLDLDSIGKLQLHDDEELELGTLISAASLMIRYVTERDAMTPLVHRFRAVFEHVLRFPLWTKALLGLKMVSLMGLTRLLESFGDHVDANHVVSNLHWLCTQFALREHENQSAFVERTNYLFRPACEQLTVAIQSHPQIQQTVYDELIPILFQLAPSFGADISDPVAGELLTTVAVIFDLRLPSPSKSAFLLLPMPAFAQDKSTASDVEEENIHILQRDDHEDDAKVATLTLPTELIVTPFAQTIAMWMVIEGRRQNVIANLPHICGAMAVAQIDVPRHLLCTTLLQSLENLPLQKSSDFEFFLSAIECIRDLGLRNAFPTGLVRDVYITLREVMPRLQAALKSLDVEPTELRGIKSTCSKTRDALVEAFVWWIHYAADTDVFAEQREDFNHSVIDKLADPRVQGDLLFVSRRLLDDEAFAVVVHAAVAPLIRAVKQLDRYAKVAAGRVIDGVSRVAFAARPVIGRFADALAGPLLQPVLDGSRKNKTPRVNAVACLLLSCASVASFLFDEHEWTKQLISVLLTASASRSIQSLIILDELVRSDARLRGFVASVAASSQEIVHQIVLNSLSSWPIFTEDLDAVLLVLVILSSLLVEERLRGAIDLPSMVATIEKLRENAQSDGQSDLIDACDDVLKALIYS